MTAAKSSSLRIWMVAMAHLQVGIFPPEQMWTNIHTRNHAAFWDGRNETFKLTPAQAAALWGRQILNPAIFVP